MTCVCGHEEKEHVIGEEECLSCNWCNKFVLAMEDYDEPIRITPWGMNRMPGDWNEHLGPYTE